MRAAEPGWPGGRVPWPGRMIRWAAGAEDRVAPLALIHRLLEAYLGGSGQSWTAALTRTELGQPRLWLEGRPGPAVSFSHGAGQVWAAVGSSAGLGLDFAAPAEFRPPYPLSRAFSSVELELAGRLLAGPVAAGAAWLWAAKEAAVKASGQGFHAFDPLEVAVQAARPWTGGWLAQVRAGRVWTSWLQPQAGGWLAVAA